MEEAYSNIKDSLEIGDGGGPSDDSAVLMEQEILGHQDTNRDMETIDYPNTQVKILSSPDTRDHVNRQSMQTDNRDHINRQSMETVDVPLKNRGGQGDTQSVDRDSIEMEASYLGFDLGNTPNTREKGNKIDILERL